jgi:hypothetical protein
MRVAVTAAVYHHHHHTGGGSGRRGGSVSGGSHHSSSHRIDTGVVDVDDTTTIAKDTKSGVPSTIEKDNFANMGQFRADDAAYATSTNDVALKKDDESTENVGDNGNKRRSAQHQAESKLQSGRSGRGGRRAGGGRGGDDYERQSYADRGGHRSTTERQSVSEVLRICLIKFLTLTQAQTNIFHFQAQYQQSSGDYGSRRTATGGGYYGTGGTSFSQRGSGANQRNTAEHGTRKKETDELVLSWL